MSIGILAFLKPWRIKKIPYVGKPIYYLCVTAVTLLVVAGVATYAACHSIRMKGPFAERMVEIGKKDSPLQVTAHELLTRWDAVHGKEPRKEEDPARRAVIEFCVKEELRNKTLFAWLPDNQQASLREAIVQLNIERQPKIDVPKVDLSTFKAPDISNLFFSSKK